MGKDVIFFKKYFLQLEIMVSFAVLSLFTIAQLNSAIGQDCSEENGPFPISDCAGISDPCPIGETRGESGFCAPMPESCPKGTRIDEDPVCEPVSEQPVEVRNVHWAR